MAHVCLLQSACIHERPPTTCWTVNALIKSSLMAPGNGRNANLEFVLLFCSEQFYHARVGVESYADMVTIR